MSDLESNVIEVEGDSLLGFRSEYEGPSAQEIYDIGRAHAMDQEMRFRDFMTFSEEDCIVTISPPGIDSPPFNYAPTLAYMAGFLDGIMDKYS